MIVFLAFFIRSYFVYSASVDNGFLVSGGSDSYYHMRVIDVVTSTGQHLVYDPLLNYPMGIRNERPPLYDWSVAVVGMFVSSVTGIATSTAVGYSLVLSTAVWGALTVIPVYLLARKAFGNRAGIVAALLLAIMAGDIERSVMTDADHDSMVLFFAVWSFYFLLMALMSIKGDKWVASWKNRKAINTGLVSYVRANGTSAIYAALAGVSLAAIAMIWTGYTYLLIVVLAYFLVQILVNRFRNADSMGVVMVVGIMLSVAFIIMAPLYYQMDYWHTWFDVPVYLFLLAMVVGGILVVTRDYPWSLVMPSLIILASIALLFLSMFFPNIFEAVITGQGYLVKSKLYSTISEAQAPEFSTLALSFGVVTFWLSFVGVVWAAMKVPKNPSPYLIFVVIWTGVSMFMAVSAARFMFNAAPAFAITAGWIIALIVEKLRFGDVFKVFTGVKGSPLTVLRKGVKIRHVFGALFLVFLILLPNAWNAVDAAIPSELKLGYDMQVYDLMKGVAKPPGYDEKNGTNWYFGGFAYDLPMPTNYWPAAWQWFSQQDSQLNPVARPAFVSWWDYGFEAAQQGKHPTVADNFQNGYQFAASVITCQSEQEAIALFIVRTLEKTGVANDSIAQVLRDHGVDYPKLRDIMENPSRYVEIVKNNPDIYGPYESDLSAANAKYAAARVELSKIGTDGLVDLYHDLREMTGIDIGYFAIDTRLFPFSATGGNIFYAPAKLGDRRIGQSNDPIDFLVTKAVDSQGNEYDLANVTSDMNITGYVYVYEDMFYNSLLYRAFMGYGPSDIGYTSQGLPGISGSLASLPAMQCWNMTHFRMVYRTAYYNPFPQDQVSNHTDAWRAISYDDALALNAQISAGEATGTIDASSSALEQGVVFAQYYDGAVINGTVRTEGGQPYPNIWVTVLDEYGIPHDTVKTDNEGRYSVIAPFGMVDLVYSYGALDLRTQVGTEISSKTLNITYAQAMRQEDFLINGDVVLPGSSLSGKIYWDNVGNGTFTAGDDLIQGASAILENESMGFTQQAETNVSGYSFVDLPAVDADLFGSYNGHEFGRTQQVLQPEGNTTVDIGVKPAALNVTIVTSSGAPVSGLELALTDMVSGTVNSTTTNSSGMCSFEKLLPGNYSLEVVNSSLSIGSQLFSVTEGAELQKQITVYAAFSLSGRVTLDMQVVANATIGLTFGQTREWTTTDDGGRFAVTLPEGDYTVYCLVVKGGKEYVALSKVEGTAGVRNIDLALQPGNIVSGTVVEGTDRVANSTVILESRVSGALINVVTSSTGQFRVVVPADTYFIYANGTAKAFWDDVIVTSSEVLNIGLSNSVTISGQVWFDSNFNGARDQGEGVSNVSLTVSDRDARAVTFRTDSQGNFQLLVPSAKSYSLGVVIDGYVPKTFNYTNMVSSVTENIELVPMNRTTIGSVVLGTSPLAGIIVTFQATSGGAITESVVTGPSGLFSLQLRPGQYQVLVDQNVTAGSNATIYQYSSSMNIAIGQDPSPLSIGVIGRTRVFGHLLPERGLTATITFTGPENRMLTLSTSSFDLYLMPGNYTIYVLYSGLTSKFAFLGAEEIIEGSSPLDITTEQAYSTSGTIEFAGSPLISVVPVTISKPTGGTITINSTIVGSFEAVLPAGAYNISVDYHTTTHIALQERYVRYTANDTIMVPLTVRESLGLERTLDNSTVSGSIVGADGTPVSAVLEIISDGETSINSTVVSGLGSYVASLAPGDYVFYVRETGGMGVYFARLEVEPYSNMTLNITLMPGMRMAGVTLNGGVPGPASLDFSGLAHKTISSASDGSYEIVLPAGDYSIWCNASVVEKSVPVQYKSLTNITLTSDLNRILSLDKVTVHGVDIQWDSREKMTLSPGETATYNLRIINTGNVPDVFRLQLEAGTWAVNFSQSEVAIGFGQENSQLVTVYLTAPSNAKVAHAGQMISVVSASDSTIKKSVMLDATILPVYSVSLVFTKPVLTTGANYTSVLTLDNTGNADDTYNVTIANKDYLATLGWDAQLGTSAGAYVDNLTASVSSGLTQDLNLKLTPTRTNPDPSVQANVVAMSQNSPNTYSVLDLKPTMPKIGIPSSGVTVSGQDVSVEPGKVPVETIVLAGMCIASFAVLILLSLQRGLFRRRKR
jgi:dolichyl-diphosphooligosaccharide--protein glycosyltransferase